MGKFENNEEIFEAIEKTVALHRPGAKILLAFDCCPAHIEQSVLRYATVFFGPLLLFPGQLGWLFDILDTKVFNAFKQDLHVDGTAMKMASTDGRLKKPEWTAILYKNITKYFQEANYKDEFPRHGLSTNADLLRDPIKRLLPSAPLGAPRKLTRPELEELLGMKRNIYKFLFEGSRYANFDVTGQPLSSSSSSSSSSSTTLPIPHGTKLPGFKSL